MVSFPNAKINIGLNVVEKRQDGFHNIETVFYPVELCDVIEFIENPNETIFNNTGIKVEGNNENNLIIKACNLLRNKYPIPHLSLHLHKIIPMGAGLGGGSSDAAFTIKSLTNYFKIGLTNEEQEELASRLGSDCAFFIRNRPIFAYEKGNKFKDIELSLIQYNVVIVYPHIHVSTQEAYSSVKPAQPDKSLLEAIKLPIGMWKDHIKNDFETGVFKKHPLLKEIKDELYSKGAVYASMTGSGSAIYGFFESDPEISSLKKNFFVWTGKLNK